MAMFPGKNKQTCLCVQQKCCAEMLDFRSQILSQIFSGWWFGFYFLFSIIIIFYRWLKPPISSHMGIITTITI